MLSGQSRAERVHIDLNMQLCCQEATNHRCRVKVFIPRSLIMQNLSVYQKKIKTDASTTIFSFPQKVKINSMPVDPTPVNAFLTPRYLPEVPALKRCHQPNHFTHQTYNQAPRIATRTPAASLTSTLPSTPASSLAALTPREWSPAAETSTMAGRTDGFVVDLVVGALVLLLGSGSTAALEMAVAAVRDGLEVENDDGGQVVFAVVVFPVTTAVTGATVRLLPCATRSSSVQLEVVVLVVSAAAAVIGRTVRLFLPCAAARWSSVQLDVEVLVVPAAAAVIGRTVKLRPCASPSVQVVDTSPGWRMVMVTGGIADAAAAAVIPLAAAVCGGISTKTPLPWCARQISVT